MTPEDLALDADVLLKDQPLILYRLVRAKYANLSGAGAALYPGRWNRLGQEAIYTSTEHGVPVLERLVHTPKDLIPANLALMKIRVSGEWIPTQEHGLFDLHTRGSFWFRRTLIDAKRAFDSHLLWLIEGGIKPFAVAVPSVIIPVWNVVLYPQGFGFRNHVSVEPVERFEFDPRLLPEGTPSQAHEQEEGAPQEYGQDWF